MLDMPQDGFASLKVYNLMGQVVATLHEGNLAAKTYTFNWNAAHMASGLYIVKAESANNVDLQKAVMPAQVVFYSPITSNGLPK